MLWAARLVPHGGGARPPARAGAPGGRRDDRFFARRRAGEPGAEPGGAPLQADSGWQRRPPRTRRLLSGWRVSLRPAIRGWMSSTRARKSAPGVHRKLTAIIEREGDGYVALCPELDIASQGHSVEEARRNLVEALELFLETASATEIQERLHPEVYV